MPAAKPVKPSELDNAVRFSFSLPPSEAKEIDAAAAALRKKTGELIQRSELVRAALLHYVSLPVAQQLQILGGVERLRKSRKL